MSAFIRGMTVLLCVFALVACEEEEGAAAAPETDVSVPDILLSARTSCESDGGRFGLAPNGNFACFKDLSDANKSCRAKSDCQGLCLARSRTCSPFKPFFGCHETLSSRGLPQTQCIE